MRPLRLEIEGFGPYAGKVELDFRELEPYGLFLMHGPTGSGKSMILDALCFALYGEAASSERDAAHLRSDHIPGDGAPARVIFEFQVRDRIYRVSRSPSQEVPGRKSRRPTRVSLEVKEDVGGRFEPLGEAKLGVREVNRMIEGILHLDADQFRRVVVLPQGEFRRFLSARTSEKGAILERLFRADFYAFLQRLAAERAKESRVRLERILAREAAVLERASVAGPRELEERRRRVERRIEKARRLIGRLEERAAVLEDTIRGCEATLGEWEELRRARETYRRVEREHRLAAADRERLEGAEAASALCDAWKGIENLGLDLQRLERRRKTLQERIRDCDECIAELEEECVSVERARKLSPLLREFAGTLDELVRVCGERRGLLDSLDATRERAERLRRDLELCTKSRAGFEEERARLEVLAGERGKCLARAGLLERAADLRRELERIRAARREHEENLSRLRESLDELECRAGELEGEYEELLHSWRRTEAARLAGQLRDGCPCPVCGSREHPAPASRAADEGDAPSWDEVEARRMRMEECRSGIIEKRTRLKGVEEKLAELAEREEQVVSALRELLEDEALRGDVEYGRAQESASVLEGELERARRRLEEIEKASAAVSRLDEALERKRSEEKELERALSALEGERKAYGASLAKLDSEYERLVRRACALASEPPGDCPAALRFDEGWDEEALREEADALRGRIEELDQRAGSLSAKRDALRERKSAAREEAEELDETLLRKKRLLEEESERFEQRLKEKGFSSCEEFLRARIDEDRLRDLRERVAELDERFESARLLLDEHERKCASFEPEGAVRERLERTKRSLAVVKRRLAGVARRLGSLESEMRDADESLRLLASLSEEIGREREHAQACVALADLLEGVAPSNPRKVAFREFVLGWMLDEVLVLANRRLHSMTGGRYSLSRLEEGRDKRGRGGLDLAVLDSCTARRRPVSTLSGGEGFMASLALALGLADGVQRMAGGMELGMLFIDEGFGSLDPESLDRAVAVLSALQGRTGRMVGVISHVPELRERIPARVEIVPSAGGSRLRLHLP